MRTARRAIILGVACLLVIAAGKFVASLEPTPSTGLGPFFPPADGWEDDNDLTRLEGRTDRPQGEIFTLEGTVRDSSGKALRAAEVVIWQTDIWGKYRHPNEDRRRPDGSALPLDPAFQYSGRTLTDKAGGYSFRTIVPGTYGRPRHIHMRIEHPDHETLATEVHFAGDLWSDEDHASTEADEDRLAITLVPGSGGSEDRARFDIVLP